MKSSVNATRPAAGGPQWHWSIFRCLLRHGCQRGGTWAELCCLSWIYTNTDQSVNTCKTDSWKNRHCVQSYIYRENVRIYILLCSKTFKNSLSCTSTWALRVAVSLFYWQSHCRWLSPTTDSFLTVLCQMSFFKVCNFEFFTKPFGNFHILRRLQLISV